MVYRYDIYWVWVWYSQKALGQGAGPVELAQLLPQQWAAFLR